MGKVILGTTISVDGFINDRTGSVAALYPDLAALLETKPLKESIQNTGAVVMGRNSFAMAEDPDSLADNYEYQVPIFILTHQPPKRHPKENGELTFTFVTDGIESAIRQAKAAAGEKDVTVIGATSTAQQCLRAGLADELHIDIMPVLLCSGLRFFESIEIDQISLERMQVMELPAGRTHLEFRILKPVLHEDRGIPEFLGERAYVRSLNSGLYQPFRDLRRVTLIKSKEDSKITNKKSKSSYVLVNGLNMYYEIHGTGQPLVLLHGAFSAIGTSFGKLLPSLANTRQVIAFELQAHGRTEDINRPLTLEGMADDVAAALGQLGVEHADIFGYSMGAGVALHLAIRHPEAVRKLVLASVTYTLSGVHPGLMEGLGDMKPEMMFGSPWHEEYTRIAPHPEDFNKLFTKKTQMDRQIRDLPAETIQAIKSPTLLIIGDSDLVRPEHAVEMFRLLGGGVFGDTPAGLPDSQLAVLPGTSHVTLVDRAGWLVSMIETFLDTPVKNE